MPSFVASQTLHEVLHSQFEPGTRWGQAANVRHAGWGAGRWRRKRCTTPPKPMMRSGVIDKLRTADPIIMKGRQIQSTSRKVCPKPRACLGYIVLTYLFWLCSWDLIFPLQPPYVVPTIPSLSSSHVSHSPPVQRRRAPNSVIRRTTYYNPQHRRRLVKKLRSQHLRYSRYLLQSRLARTNSFHNS